MSAAHGMLSIDHDRDVTEKVCDHCGEPRLSITGALRLDGAYFAPYFASCYHHEGHEVWIDVVYSHDWDAEVQQRVTFGCRVGPVSHSPHPASTMVDAATIWADDPFLGRKLSRAEALAHAWRDQFWAHTDFILVNDPDVAAHMGYR